ncbi:uncharacterized protein LOC129758119 [Uranotaenia lowii]|uniref:uncharacterized protein LOC129758119 n=1 Tax=Uranotaenia lowii TaxID=190385 RepID=UPI00247B1671|nr:uncharacterized protein LOC129758119 [Uranotaenia lowii]
MALELRLMMGDDIKSSSSGANFIIRYQCLSFNRPFCSGESTVINQHTNMMNSIIRLISIVAVSVALVAAKPAPKPGLIAAAAAYKSIGSEAVLAQDGSVAYVLDTDVHHDHLLHDDFYHHPVSAEALVYDHHYYGDFLPDVHGPVAYSLEYDPILVK